jgi:hypothetical protein
VRRERPLLGIDETLAMLPIVEFMERDRRPDCASRPHGGDAGEMTAVSANSVM